MLVSKVYMHIAFAGWNLYPPFSKKMGGTDPTRAMHHTAATYIKILRLVKSTMNFWDFTMRKYRLIAIIPMVRRDAIESVNWANPWNRQTFSSKIHLPRIRVAIVKGILQIDIRISLTANAITNMLVSVRSLWFLCTAKKTKRLPKKAAKFMTENRTVSIQTTWLLLVDNSTKYVSSIIGYVHPKILKFWKFSV